MQELTSIERELVALGAALGSNCIPCIEYHIPEARKAGLCDRKISEAVRLADKVRQVPAGKVLATARGMLAETNVKAPAPLGSSESAESVAGGGPEEPCCN